MSPKIKNLFRGISKKAFIPSLPNVGINVSGSRLNKYDNPSDQLQANMGWVFACNDIIAEKCASVELVIKDKKSGEVVEDEKLMQLIHNPNNLHNGTQFIELYYTYMNLTGEAYILLSEEVSLNRLPDALHILPTHLVQYEMKDDLSKSILRYGSQVFTADVFMRSIKPDPMNPWVGRGVVASSINALNVDTSTQQFNANFFANQAVPSAVLEIEETLDKDAHKRLKQELETMYSGTANAGKVMVVEGKSKFSPFMLTQKEMQYLEQRKFSMVEILAMFRVSPGMLGMVEDVNRSNMEASKVIFSENIIVPRVRKFVEFMNNSLVSKYNPSIELCYVDPTPENTDAILKDIDRGFNRWYTRNEVRRMQGMDDVDGGDEFVADSPELPETIQRSSDEKQAKEPTQKREVKKKLYDTQEEFEEVGAIVTHYRDKRLDKFESEFSIASRKVFEAIRADMRRNLKEQKKQFKRKGIVNLLPDFKKHKVTYIALLAPVYTNLVEREGTAALTLVAAQSDFDIQDPEVALFIENWSKKISDDVVGETEKQLRATLTQGIDNKETIEELTARVEETLGLTAQSRAYKIARTESSRVAKFSDIAAWEQSGVVSGKVWYTALDDRVCPICAPMHEKELPLKGVWYKDGSKIPAGENKDGTKRTIEAYGDIDGHPIHASCRCSLLPITD